MKTTSKISTLIMAIAVTGMLALGGATTAHAQGLRAFNATLNQARLVSQTCNGSVCDLVFEGDGSANIMGHVTWTIHVVQDLSVYPCNPGIAEATLVGATGSITYTYTCGTVCASPAGPATIQGIWNVTGGTGQFSGIGGGGSDQGTIAGNGPNVHSSGVVAY
jgi:hypothetical protein